MEMVDTCRLLNVLPRSGGLLDQDWIEIRLLRTVTIAYLEKEERDRPKT